MMAEFKSNCNVFVILLLHPRVFMETQTLLSLGINFVINFSVAWIIGLLQGTEEADLFKEVMIVRRNL